MALILNYLSSVSTLCLLLIIVSLQISQLRGQSVELVSASGSACTQDCGPGYKCVSGRCERENCNIDCTGKAIQVVCGSDSVTYDNMCELTKARCEKAMHISAEYDGTCITLPPPPKHNCMEHQQKWDTDTANIPDYMAYCNFQEVFAKGRAGTLQIEDVIPCYRPQCQGELGEKYAHEQCSSHAQGWCWCSTEEGDVILGTFEQNKKSGACENRKMCEVDGVQYNDGVLFTPSSGCGFCECLDGEVTCFEDYVPNVSGQLNSTQLAQLKTELVLLFYFQQNHEERKLVDVRHIHRYPTTVTESIKQNILREKFDSYDLNKDKLLYPAEQFVFRTELHEFVRCSAFFDHVTELIDEDSTGTISLDEWNRFFDENTSSGSTSGSTNGPDVSVGGSSSPVKRSVPSSSSFSVPVMRKPLHLRKKFQYILF